jgi:hypothetical protein
MGSVDRADVAITDSGDKYGPEYVTIDRDGIGSTTLHNAAHIARHDPARVLAQCAAIRRAMAEHPEDDDGYCTDNQDIGVGWRLEHGCGWLYPCPTVRALASIWADHPDFDPAWEV